MNAADPRPAHQEYAKHVKRCRAAEHGSWECQACRDLERQASAEMWRRQGRTGKALVGAPTATSAARQRD